MQNSLKLDGIKSRLERLTAASQKMAEASKVASKIVTESILTFLIETEEYSLDWSDSVESGMIVEYEVGGDDGFLLHLQMECEERSEIGGSDDYGNQEVIKWNDVWASSIVEIFDSEGDSLEPSSELEELILRTFDNR